MTESRSHGCSDCERSFDSGRALTQHTRYVHEGAALFGQRLLNESEELIEPQREEDYWFESESEDDSESTEENEQRELLDSVLAATLLAVLAGMVFFWLTSAGPPTPPARLAGTPFPPSPSPPFGAGWRP